MSNPVIVFDLDGTLVDTAPDLLSTLNAVLAPEGFEPVTGDAIVGYIGRGARVMIERVYADESRPLSEEKRDALFRAFLAHYDDHLADLSRAFAGAEAALDRFAGNGWRLAVCTNKLGTPSRKLLRLLGLEDRFAVIAGQDTFGVAKPDPRHLLETIRAAGGSPERAVMVGDSSVDVDTAIAAQIPVVVVSFGYSPVPATELGATTVIDHFDQLYPAATEIISRRALRA
jgi:phosphoglycolate phosphatase